MKNRRQTNSQSGIAIGLILLAVVLIGGIVSAVAVSSQSDSISAKKESDFLMVQGVLINMQKVRQAALRYEVITGQKLAGTLGSGGTGFDVFINLGLLSDNFNLFQGFGPPTDVVLFDSLLGGVRPIFALSLPLAQLEPCIEVNRVLFQADGPFDISSSTGAPGAGGTLAGSAIPSDGRVPFDFWFEPGNIACMAAGSTLYLGATI